MVNSHIFATKIKKVPNCDFARKLRKFRWFLLFKGGVEYFVHLFVCIFGYDENQKNISSISDEKTFFCTKK